MPEIDPKNEWAPGRPWSVEGPVQAEVFVLRMRAGRPELAGPCGPDPWYVELTNEDDPLEECTGCRAT